LVEAEEEDLIQATLRGLNRAILLWLLDQKHMSGYMVTKEIRRITGQHYSSGGVYPLLYGLEEKGFIKGEWKQRGRRRIKYYSITEKGQKMLNNIRSLLEMPIRGVLKDLLRDQDSLKKVRNNKDLDVPNK